MIHLSKMIRGGHYGGDAARFPQKGAVSAPVVVWHMTEACNLRCRHCYASNAGGTPMERAETLEFMDAVASMKPPTLLLSGGEPLMHGRFFEYLAWLSEKGVRVSLSTNGTMIDGHAASVLKERVGYVGVSIDGKPATHDGFRGVRGAFDETVRGIENLKRAGCRVGLRFTMARPLLREIPFVLELAEELGADRVCLYHFMPSGRGGGEPELLPERSEIRDALFSLFERVARGGKNFPEEVLTVGNFADGILLYLNMLRHGDLRAADALALLERGRGGRSGHGIVSVRWDGSLFADQFSWDRPLGRWTDLERWSGRGPASAPRFSGRCGRCRWAGICRGNMRSRAAALTGDIFGEDPGCPLEEEEIRL